MGTSTLFTELYDDDAPPHGGLSHKNSPKPKTKLIFSPQLAQWLLQNKYRIIELKPHKTLKNATVFVFEESPGFLACIEAWVQNKSNYIQ